ncbi:integrase family protein [Afipia sp. Root123D2]|uniref:tyrosine-type recombinase/integrase n=1 Tax=Afipia sp. Root123D2 TaxID=1736436 RepID=UPI000AE6A7BB|nr:integrase family protein [Afipia sp. Root123D2]
MKDQPITKSLIDGLRPGAKEYCVWDARLAGFGVRVRPTGSKSYIVVYRAGSGRRAPFRRYTIAAIGRLTPDEARGRAKRILGDVAHGQDPADQKRRERTKRKATTFDELAGFYLDQYAKVTKSSWKNDEGYLKRPRAKWGKRPAADVSDDDVAELLDEIARTAPVSANRTQSVLHTLFAWAKEPGRKYVNANPVSDMKRRSKECKRERVLDDSEIRRLWWGLDDPALPASRSVALALKFILATMVRPAQAAGALTSELIDLGCAQAEYHIPRQRVKWRREVIQPLNGLATSLIKDALTNDKQTAVFPGREINEPLRRNSLSQALTGKPDENAEGERRADIRAFLGMAHFTPHDLRRTAATLARRAGARREDVKATLDHLEGDVTAVYDKYDMVAEKREVANVLAAELLKIIGNGPEYIDCEQQPRGLRCFRPDNL